ncbi:MAG: hypothetical protein ACLFSA_10160, partial [Spirochaetaceae bacterium]
MQDFEIYLVRPPVFVRGTAAGDGFTCSARYRAPSLFAHFFSPYLFTLLLESHPARALFVIPVAATRRAKLLINSDSNIGACQGKYGWAAFFWLGLKHILFLTTISV